MKAVVTGCAGFIGSTLVDRLLAEGYDVVGIDSFTDYYDPQVKRRNLEGALRHPAFTLLEGDLVDRDLAADIADAEHVYHLAGQPGVRSSWGDEFEIYLSANVLATQRLLEAAKESAALRRFVYASSSSVYGEAERFPTEETDRPMPRSPYGATKLAGENLCALYAASFGVPTVALRFFTVYGPRQRPDMAFHRFIRAALLDSAVTVYGDGEQVREFTHVDDIVAANMKAATRDVPAGSIINLSGGSSVTVNDVLRELGEILGRPVGVDHFDSVAGDVRRTGGSIDRARQLLDWSPAVPLRAGLESEHAWLAAEMGVRG